MPASAHPAMSRIYCMVFVTDTDVEYDVYRQAPSRRHARTVPANKINQANCITSLESWVAVPAHAWAIASISSTGNTEKHYRTTSDMLGTSSFAPGFRTHGNRYRHRSRTTQMRPQALFQNTKSKDATAELLQTAIRFALQSRLKQHDGIQVNVESNALDLLGGKFGGMTVDGRRWKTPLVLTAESIKVSVGELIVDQTALVFQQRVGLKNIPIGACTLVLSPSDLGHFMDHPIMKNVSAKTVNGQPFVFDQASVRYQMTGPGTGMIYYSGKVGGKGPTYDVSMTANVAGRGAAAGSRTGVTSHIKVAAQKRQDGSTAATDQGQGSDPEDAAVSEALSQLFNNLTLNLQGVELSKPALRLIQGPLTGQHKLLLEISMTLRLLDLPPLNMKF